MTMKPIAPKTVCKDGTRLSIQASESHYSTPRKNKGPYSAVEVGFIEDKDGKALAPPEEWAQYADGDFPSDVYGYIPSSVVIGFIAQHGGTDALPECLQ